MEKIIISWSGGKDSSLALYYLLREKKFNIKILLTTISAKYNRISIHGVRKDLLEKQAQSIGIPLHIIILPDKISNESYENIMKREMLELKTLYNFKVAFGDIFLEDIRKYREANLSKLQIKAVFPLWGKSSRILANEFIDLGFKAIIVCTDSTILDKSFLGNNFDDDFLNSIPSDVDPCGENGEFHTFVFDGPLFKKALKYKKGKVVYKEDRFYFIDLK